MKIRTDYTCPLEIVHDIIKGKWKTIILYQMKDRPKSLSELEQGIDGISQKMLLEQLKELIQFGLVEKKKFIGYPLHVEYSLTRGRGVYMIEALKIMQKIGVDYMLEYGMDEELICKGILTEEEIESIRLSHGR
ncbi:MAG: helix-turn-helix transcriptional regulator [Lachnospiraceae bacterium]|nr:helix-turn-helix transcriptional regulator [Lachnospiraceae bacterium]